MLRRTMIMALTALALASPVCAVELGDDGLHKAPWLRETFKDLREDLAEAEANDQRLMVIIEQRGCIYCTRMHEEVFVQPEIEEMLENDYFVVRLNMFGDVEVTDFDGTTLPEKQMVAKWGALFTPTMMFFPHDVPEGETATQAAVATMPGAFGASTTFDLLNWVRDEGYLGEEGFQTYHARMHNAREGGG
ncbi:thioredoxin family protein [Paracoccus albicereus]|uniref:thioredoxin family protein n=1 Tax=Paracoccus albicereus TaxID=2922394 RepID=UPI003F76BD67